jgi:phospholipid/cholesterol/gamma-HCH transport system permease protein
MTAPTLTAPLPAALIRVGAMTSFFGELLMRAVTPPWYPSIWLRSAAILVRRCFPPLLVVLLGLGGVMAVQANHIFQMVRADALVGALIGVFTFRELGPVIASVLIGAQGGSFVATELGAMRIREEFDALELMAVDPMRYAVVPRFMGFVIAAPILCMLANVAGLVGGWGAMMVVGDTASGTFWASTFEYLQPLDLVNGLVKSVVFGALMGHITCWYGAHVSGGAAQVGRAANRAVVLSLIGVLIANYLVSSILYAGAAGVQRW